MAFQLEGTTTLLQVFDMPMSIAFYRDVLGFEIVTTSPPRGRDDFDWGLLRRDGLQLMLNTAYELHERPPAPVSARIAAHGDTAIFFSCRDLDAVYAHLRAHGVEAHPPKDAPYGMRQLWLHDADRYVICFQRPTAQSNAAS
jgi:catechol 2,3-dioxygenase-like lactoylglutathione lyase family enzyme